MSKIEISEVKLLHIKKLALAIVEKYGSSIKAQQDAYANISKFNILKRYVEVEDLTPIPKIIEITQYPRELVYIFKNSQTIIPYQLINISSRKEEYFQEVLNIAFLSIYSQMLLSSDLCRHASENLEKILPLSKDKLLKYVKDIHFLLKNKDLKSYLKGFIQNFQAIFLEIIRNSELGTKFSKLISSALNAKVDFLESFFNCIEGIFRTLNLFNSIIFVKVEGSKNLNIKNIIINSQKKTSNECSLIVLQSSTKNDLYICPPEVKIVKEDKSTHRALLAKPEGCSTPQKVLPPVTEAGESHMVSMQPQNFSISEINSSSNSKKFTPVIFSREKNFIKSYIDKTSNETSEANTKRFAEVSELPKAAKVSHLKSVETSLQKAEQQNSAKKITPEKTTNLSSEKEHISIRKVPKNESKSPNKIVLKCNSTHAHQNSPSCEQLSQYGVIDKQEKSLLFLSEKPKFFLEKALENFPNYKGADITAKKGNGEKFSFFNSEKESLRRLGFLLEKLNINTQRNSFLYREIKIPLFFPGDKSLRPPTSSERRISSPLNNSLPQTTRSTSSVPQKKNLTLIDATKNINSSTPFPSSLINGYVPYSMPLGLTSPEGASLLKLPPPSAMPLTNQRALNSIKSPSPHPFQAQYPPCTQSPIFSKISSMEAPANQPKFNN